MKALSKPLSSPSRTENLPPPLMIRFLRGNVGSRSRGRSRSRPIFFYNLRSKKNVIEKNQLEPSSPKVTCIRQVRVRRSKGKKRGGGATGNHRHRWWRRMRRSFLCGKVSPRFWNKKALFRKVCCLDLKWGVLCRPASCCKKVDASDSEDSFRFCNNDNRHPKGGKNTSFAADNCGNNNDRASNGSEGGGNYDFRRRCDYSNMENVSEISSKRGLLDDECGSCASTSPPKNALLLTRCRSAPYRSSWAAGKFCNTQLTETNVEDAEQNDGKSEEDTGIGQESSKESMENVPRSCIKFNQDVKSSSIHPLLLTRSKSEPARTGLRLINPEANVVEHR